MLLLQASSTAHEAADEENAKVKTAGLQWWE